MLAELHRVLPVGLSALAEGTGGPAGRGGDLVLGRGVMPGRVGHRQWRLKWRLTTSPPNRGREWWLETVVLADIRAVLTRQG
jgi:hypothetical protein